MPTRTRRHKKMRGGTHTVPFFTEHTAKNGPRVISGVPLAIYQSWVTNAIPAKMHENMKALLEANPEFDHYLYSHERCLQFIKDNYPQKVVDAYKSLKPGAYKSDLWRYCILYKLGGVYLDVKFYTTVPIVNLLEKYSEIYSRDIVAENTDDKELKCKAKPAVYNGFLVTPPNNNIFKDCIYEIVKNCQKRNYTNSILHITGPCLLGRFVKKHKGENFIGDNKFQFIGVEENGVVMGNIIQGDKTIVKQYPEYRDELSGSKVEHYTNMWRRKNVYEGGTRKQRGGNKGPIVFKLTDMSGFGSMTHFLVQAYIVAKKENRPFFIDDTKWHFGDWHDYFKSLKIIDRSLINGKITEYTHANTIAHSSVNEHKEAIKDIYILNDNLMKSVNDFKQKIGAPYKALYVRRGDKTSGKAKENDPIDLSELLKGIDIKAGDNLFVMTDDYTVIEELNKLIPDVKISTMTPSTARGADCMIEQALEGDIVKEHGNELFISIQIVLGATKGWVDNRSNMGRFIWLASPETMYLYPSDSNNINISPTTIVNPGFKSISA